MDFLHKIESSLENNGLVKRLQHALHLDTDAHAAQAGTQAPAQAGHRFGSFAPQTTGQVKWHVDGASYFWAVSEALEAAKESIYIMDWWLSPELYLRRPPSGNEQYRLDTMLKAAAQRGVRIHVIIYKEVEKALTLNSQYTKQHLESLHGNIAVMRHPDHVLSPDDVEASLETGIADLGVSNFQVATAPRAALKAIFGTSDDVVLFWAHHEKLLVIDRKLAFMGGLDLCFGRWDTSSHPIADAHPGNLDAIVFPGQDYNNARIYDFANVNNWQENKLDRTKSSRMGWSDVSFSLQGPIVDSLIDHFTDRWNYIFRRKYDVRDDPRFQPLSPSCPKPQGLASPTSALVEAGTSLYWGIHDRFASKVPASTALPPPNEKPAESQPGGLGTHIQLTRSCSPWSSGHTTEHSIANAYVYAITNASHFVYIENQFFITATSSEQRLVHNPIGKAIVDRILRAHQASEDFSVIVVMPAVPGFAGDLQSKDALGTRAIMEFQYHSINRGGRSIMGALKTAGVADPSKYISFYNLRNYDRINVSAVMAEAEKKAGVLYEKGRKEHDDMVGAGYPPMGEGTAARDGDKSQFDRYQNAASKVYDATWDTVSACYMASGPSLDKVVWQGDPKAELDAFVSEELYIHTKLLIADDRLVICGSANLNDRSQLGTHDSEIAVVVEDTTALNSVMGGQPFVASSFAASLRRYIFRKHLGMLPDQHMAKPTGDWHPVSAGLNDYDWGSAADVSVRDPLDVQFRRLWADTARTNTEAFSRAFHNVPNDKVQTWAQYDDFFTRHFYLPGGRTAEMVRAGKVEYGHVVREEFPGGVGELKACLAGVRGTLVEMPLRFLADVPDLARTGLELNSFTEELYT